MAASFKPWFADRYTPTWSEYDRRKEAWLRARPEAESKEIEKAFRAIADDLGL